MFGHIHGIVSNSTSGEPLRNVNVSLLPGGKSTVTGSDGSFEYQKLTPGQYVVQVQSEGYVSNSKTITVEPDVIVRCDVSMAPSMGNLYVNASSLEFGASGGSRSFVISNNGSGNLSWQISYQCAWITSLSSSSGSIPAGRTATVTVHVDPSKVNDARESALLFITSDSGDATVSVTVAKASQNEPGSDPPVQPSPPVSTVTSGLYVYFPFEGNTRNMTETNLNAVAVNEPVYETGSIDGSTSIKFSRTRNSYLNIPEGLIDRKSFSISFWIRGAADGSVFHVEDKDGDPSFTLIVRNGKLAFVVSPYSTIATYSHGNITDNQWHLITLTSTCDNSFFYYTSTKLYLDGEYTDILMETTYLDDYYDYGIRFIIGGAIGSGLPGIDMNIDNLRIYNTRELSADEIRKIYKAEGGG
ncbi:MAG: carboxypeptidase regulatory-like domain-containing protein [Tannerella sp.]|nr:carboxypeptidase regulatory-like domain-containing protein [Tannerella sp.]